MKKAISILLAILMLMSAFAGLNVTASAAPVADHDGWLQGEQGEWYYIENGTPVCEDWRYIGGKWYWFFDDGEMASNCRVGIPNSSGKESIYVFAKSGAMLANGWGKITDEYGYTEWHYINKNGSAVTSSWIKDGGKWYWLEEDGVMASGDVYSVKNKLYAFENSGALHEKEGWFKYSWELFDGDGKKIGVDIEWVYTNKDGTCYKGWKQTGGAWYYLDPDYGYMLKDGIFRIGADEISNIEEALSGNFNFGKLYAFDKNGKMLSNQWYKGVEDGGYQFEEFNDMFIYISTNGVYNWYYLGENGAAITGWKQIKNVWYYFVPDFGLGFMMADRAAFITKDGVLLNSVESKGVPYIFKANGAMLSNEWYSHTDNDGGVEWYYASSSGILYTGWHKINGAWYYFGLRSDEENPFVMWTGWLELDDGTYYCDPATGKMVTGERIIDGYTCTFDKSGRLISRIEAS